MTAHTTEISETVTTERLSYLVVTHFNVDFLPDYEEFRDIQKALAELLTHRRRAAAPVDVREQGEVAEVLKWLEGVRDIAISKGFREMASRAIALLQRQPRDPVDVRDSAGVVERLRQLHADMRAAGMLVAMPIVKDAISALSHRAEDEWQPIATAPKDGTSFLAYRNGRVADCYRVQRDDCEMFCFGGTSAATEVFALHRPTHWKPIPAPPRAEANKEQM
jgi:hypothetical protein